MYIYLSRFARNVKEALAYVRKLKLLGVGVQFEKEGINTLSLGDEMLLNTFTAIAQEESKSISQNQRLSIVKRMELGEYVDSNISEQIEQLNKRIKAIRESEIEDSELQERLATIQSTIDEREHNRDTYDDSIVRQMIECIKVFGDGKIVIIFGGGYEVEEYLEKA